MSFSQSYYSFYICRIYLQKQITKSFLKIMYILLCQHVFLVFYYVSYLVFCSVIFQLINQNNPIAVWLRLSGMHNNNKKKTWILKNQFLQINSSYVSNHETERQHHNDQITGFTMYFYFTSPLIFYITYPLCIFYILYSSFIKITLQCKLIK